MPKSGPAKRVRHWFYVDKAIKEKLDKLGWDSKFYERLTVSMLDPILRAEKQEPETIKTIVDLIGMRKIVISQGEED